MTDGKPEPKPAERLTAAMDEFMATVLRHLRTGQSNPLEELGLDKAKEELEPVSYTHLTLPTICSV